MLRLLCPLARWQLSDALERGERSGWCAAHVARCERCAAFAGRLEALHARLAAGAIGAPSPLTPNAVRPRRMHRPLVASGALAVAGAAAVLYFLLASPAGPTGEDRPGSAPQAAADDGADTAPVDVEARTDRPAPVGRAEPLARGVVGHLSVLFTAPPPLRAELNALASDGRRGALAILDLGGVRLRASRTP
jgi:hypothetical protein